MSETTPKLKERLKDLYLIGRVIPRKEAAKEIDLVTRKWPAYRFIGPMDATRLFRDAYEAAYKEQHRVNADKDEAEKLKIGRKISFRENNDRLTQLWKARQLADCLGMPYPDYLEFCMDFASRRNQRRYPPQPNQLGPKGQSSEAWLNKFDEYWDQDRKKIALNRMAPMAQYNVSNRRGLPAQTEFVTHLLDFGADLTAGFSAFFERHVTRLGYLTLDECWVLGREQVENANRQALNGLQQGWIEVENYPALTSPDLLQSCFGVPGIDTAEFVPCGHCCHRAACEKARKNTLDNLLANTGDPDPVAAKKRAGQSERTRKSRALQKLRKA